MAAIVSEFMGTSLVGASNGAKTTGLFSKKAPAKKATVKKVAPKKGTVKKAAPKKVVKKAAPKKVAVKRAAPKPARVAPKPVKRSGGPRRGGGAKVSGLEQWYGSERKLFLPGGLLEPGEVPAYLNGSLAGDYGYDPLGLGKDGKVEEYRAFELIHSRWAMLGVAGAIIPEWLNSFSDGSFLAGDVWWQTGEQMLDGGLLKFFGAEVPLPLFVVLVLEVGLMGAVENFRATQAVAGNSVAAVETLHPGGRFDPLGFADDPDVFAELKVKEIKNGRLAMVAALGFGVQAFATGEGPYANWLGHVSDPFGYNLFTVVGNTDRVPTL